MARKKNFTTASMRKYEGMMSRCYRPKDVSYPSYGSRGIRVCGAWIKDVETFRLWLRAQLKENDISEDYFVSNSSRIQLDRIDVNGHYSPENCRLASNQLNARNRRSAVVTAVMSAEGEIISLSEVA